MFFLFFPSLSFLCLVTSVCPSVCLLQSWSLPCKRWPLNKEGCSTGAPGVVYPEQTVGLHRWLPPPFCLPGCWLSPIMQQLAGLGSYVEMNMVCFYLCLLAPVFLKHTECSRRCCWLLLQTGHMLFQMHFASQAVRGLKDSTSGPNCAPAESDSRSLPCL